VVSQSNIVRTLRLPDELELTMHRVGADIHSVGVSGGFIAQSETPVLADEVEIARACDAIRAANPDQRLLCEANVLFKAMVVPDDTRYEDQYALKRMRLPQAWDAATGNKSVIAAIIDSGIDYTHQDLVNNIAKNSGEIASNGIDDDRNGYIDDVRGYDFVSSDPDPMDLSGHGTHCAGIVGAQGNNSRGISGINWSVGLLPVRVLSAEGEGTASAVAAGIVYAVNRGVSVINLSLGGPNFSQVLEDAIEYARQRDVLVVVAAGNAGTDNDVIPTYPASSTKSNVIAVAASTSGDNLAQFSNFGGQSVDVAAPGEGILSTLPGNAYGLKDGTSMAAPHVTGLAALLKSLAPQNSQADVRDIILSTVTMRAGMRDRISTGGRVDAFSAVGAMVPLPTPTPSQTPEPANTPPPSSGGAVNPGPTPLPGTDGGGEVARLTLRVVLRAGVATLFGNVFGFQNTGLPGKPVALVCGGKEAAVFTTLADGAYFFRVRRSNKLQRCNVTSPNGVRSKGFRIPKR
jgi:subtilisin family serine protease